MRKRSVVSRFIAEIEQLTPKQWLAISKRYLDNKSAIEKAVEAAAVVVGDLAASRLMPPGETKRRIAAAAKATQRCARITGALPATMSADGKDFPVRRTAQLAAWSAMRALVVWDELKERKRGDLAARTALAPFSGYVSSLT